MKTPSFIRTSLLLSLVVIASCNDQTGNGAPHPPPPGLTVTPGSLDIIIQEPASDGAPFGKFAVLRGECGIPGNPVTVVGNGKTIYSICQNDYHWSAPVSSQGAPTGVVSFNVQLRLNDLTGGSAIRTRSFIKSDDACSDPANLLKQYANTGVGDGATIPYVVCTPQQFSNIQFNPTKRFVVGQNIHFGLVTTSPIAPVFTGELDGQGFVLSDLQIQDPGTGVSVGLFKILGSGASIKNLGIKNASVTGTQRVGILAGDWRGTGTLQNVKIQGSASASGMMCAGVVGLATTVSALNIQNLTTDVTVNCTSYAAGVVGYINTNDGSFNISNSEIRAAVTGQDFVSGVVGMLGEDASTFTNVSHRGNISATGMSVGGLVGEVSVGATFINSRHVGNLTSTKVGGDANIGGLVGLAKGITTFNGCSSVLTLAAKSNYAGGLIGRAYTTNISQSYARGSLTVADTTTPLVLKFVGGLVGGVSLGATFTDSYSQAALDAKANYVGGITGILSGATSTIQNSNNTGPIKGQVSHIGGLVGLFSGASITNSFSRGNVEVTAATPYAYIGGLVGFVNIPTAFFQRVYASGNVAILDGTADYVGGLFGSIKAQSLSQAFYAGHVTGARSRVGGIAGTLLTPFQSGFVVGEIRATQNYVGGVAGLQTGVDVSDVFVQGEVQGAGYVGGVVGGLFTSGTNATTNAYFGGSILKNALSPSADNLFGPLLGYKDSVASLQSGFYLDNSVFTNLSGGEISINTLGESRTVSQMQSSANYTGFSFPTWAMPGANFKLPFQTSTWAHAVPDWALTANHGFALPAVWNDNPQIAALPPIFDPLGTVLDSYGDDDFTVLTSNTGVTTVTPGQLQISYTVPATNGTPVSTRMVIQGECGIAGGMVELTGVATVNTICQSNLHWAVMIDFSNAPAGTLTLNTRLWNLPRSLSSAIVSRTFTKSSGSSLCADPESARKMFANSDTTDGTTIPYVICHAGQFKNIGLHPTKNFQLADNIDFGNSIIEPLPAFSGTFDGKGFRLRHFLINKTAVQNVGLFSSAQNATFQNLTLEDFTVNGFDRAGALIGAWRGTGTLTNIKLVKGSVTGLINTGGLMGHASEGAQLNLTQITSDISVTGNNYTGGLIGQIASIDGSFSADNVTLNGVVKGLGWVGGMIGSIAQPEAHIQNTQYIQQTLGVSSQGPIVGGLIGQMNSGNLSGIVVRGPVSSVKAAADVYVGGVIGQALDVLTLNNVQYQGNISAAGDRVGGVVAHALKGGSFQSLVSSGTMELVDTRFHAVRTYAGGLFGFIEDNATLLNSSSSMALNVEARNAGGLVGFFAGENSEIKNCFSTGPVTAKTSYVGGLAGIFHGSILWDSYSTGNVSISTATPNSNIGGLLGYANSLASDFRRLHATGSVTVTDGTTADYGGGLIGFFRAGSMIDSYATGAVTGFRNVSGGLVGMMRGNLSGSYATGHVVGVLRHHGGLVGYLLSTSIQNSFALGNITAGDASGGLVGYVNGSSNIIQNSYAYGRTLKSASSTVVDDSVFGPLLGVELNPGSLDQTSTFYLTTQLGTGHNSKGHALTPTQARLPAQYTGFDFTASTGWRNPAGMTIPGVSGAYLWPVLAWMGGVLPSVQFEVRGTLAGLQYGTIKLKLNAQEEVTLATGATTFAFSGKVQPGLPYDVQISAHPQGPAITCTITNATGTMPSADVTNVAVSCPTFSSIALGGTTLMAVGTSQALPVTGTLSNAQLVDVAAFTSFGLTGTGFSLSAGNLNANSAGSATVTATFLGKTSTRSFTSNAAPLPPTLPNWSGTSPSAVTALTARWTRSTSSGIASQQVDFHVGDACAGSPLTTVTTTSTATSYAFTGTDGLSYSFRVRAVSSNGLSTNSVCSSTMQVTLPTPSPVTNAAIAATWIKTALPISSPLISWTNPPSGITGVEIALGSTLGGAEVKPWASIGVVTSRTLTSISGIVACAPLYTSLRTFNSVNKRSSVVTTAPFKWDNTVPSTPGAPAASGVASTTQAPTFTWTLSSDNCQSVNYQLAIGTAAGLTDVMAWKSIGDVTSYRPTDGVDGVSLALQKSVMYYTSIRALDEAGNISAVTTSNSWIIPASLSNKVFWYDASDLTTVVDRAGVTANDAGFSGLLASWLSIGTTQSMDAVSPLAANDPSFDEALKRVNFNGSDDYITLPSSDLFDATTSKIKSAFVSFRTSDNISTRQVIFEQGNATRGMNLYLLSGNLHCAFWNTANDGDGAQAVVYSTTPITGNAIHHAALIMDYTNYTGATGPNGVFRCYLNAAQFGGDRAITSRLYAHAGSAALGATVSGTRYHDTTSSTTTAFFAGSILEAFGYEELPTPADISAKLVDQMEKWNASDLEAPGNLQISNNATTTAAATASWSAIPLFNTHHYDMAIGTSSGGTEIMGWTSIGNVLTYRPQDGVDGVSLSLSPGPDYYISVKAVTAVGTESLPSVSVPWKVVPPSATVLAGTVLKLDAQNASTLKDANSVSPGTAGFLGVIGTWINAITSGVSNFVQNTAANRPLYDDVIKGLRFDRTNDSLSGAANTTVFNVTSTQKTVSAVFTSGTDVTTRQFIFEAGSRSNRGMMIYIENGSLYCLFHNTANGGDGAQAPLFWTKPIDASTTYVVSLYLDYRNYTTPTGPNGIVGCSVNGVSLGTSATTSRLYADSSAIYAGVRNSATWHNNNSTGAGDYFGGTIHELQVSNLAPADAQTLQDFQLALKEKWK